MRIVVRLRFGVTEPHQAAALLRSRGHSSSRRPGVVKWSLSTDPMAWNLTGEFLFKDIVLLCVCAVLFLASLPQSVVQSRTAQNFHEAVSQPMPAFAGSSLVLASRKIRTRENPAVSVNLSTGASAAAWFARRRGSVSAHAASNAKHRRCLRPPWQSQGAR